MTITKKVFRYLLLLISIGIWLLVVAINSESSYRIEETVIIGFYFATLIVYALVLKQDKLEIFYPIHFVTLLYLCIFVFCPIYLIEAGRTTCNGYYIMDGAIKATFVFFVSYVALVLGYVSIKTPEFDSFSPILDHELSKGYKQRIIIVCLGIWALGMLINLYYLFKSGMSLSYILTLGSQGIFEETNAMSEVSFVSNFGYFMVIPWLYILYYSENPILKLFITALTFVLYLVRGFRFIIIVMVIAIALCYYRKKRSHPSRKMFAIAVIGALLFISIMGFMRHGLRTGSVTDWSSFSIDDILYALETNFNIYKPFYGLVTHYPSQYAYTLGGSMIYDTITHFIPRAIWPGKPLAIYSTMAIAMKNSTNAFTLDHAAMAWPNLGEYYMEFGIIGSVLIMFWFGRALKKSIRLYESTAIDDIILYAVFYGFTMQIITRGYTPTIVGLLIFLYLPAIVIRAFTLKGVREQQ